MAHRETLLPNFKKLDVALRALGYSFETAVADIIDNSIDAGARSILVRLVARPDRPLDLVIWDDGRGMNPRTLKEAMRFGANVTQELHRLGKFGLGLKLASLNQARAMKVCSLQNGRLSGRGYLEDGLARGFVSEVFEPAECRAAIKQLIPDQRLPKSGTLVWWSHLYRVGRAHGDPNAHAQNLLSRLRNHLSLAFHRFLNGCPRKVEIRLDISDGDSPGIAQVLEPLDPFGYSRTGRKGFPIDLTAGGDLAKLMRIRAHIWPPNSEDPNYKLPGGANSRQGFYFYRHDRLIQAGGWNGLREAEPHLSLARLEIDVAADFDVEVNLDVKKVEIQLTEPLEQALTSAMSPMGIDYRKYLSLAQEMYRTRTITDSELPLIPSRGLPAPLRKFLHKELRIKATTRHRDLRIEWAHLDDESFFDFDRDRGRLYLNRQYRSQLLHGLNGSSSDVPVVKCMLFLLLRDAILSQRTGSRVREEIDQVNHILMEAVKYERVSR